MRLTRLSALEARALRLFESTIGREALGAPQTPEYPSREHQGARGAMVLRYLGGARG